jgi:hypothetical protein
MSAAKRSNTTQTNKTNYMSDGAFADLKQAVEDALAYERGERCDVHVTRIKAPRPRKDRMEASEGIKRGLESMKRNAGEPADKFFRDFFAEKDIPERE